MLKLELILKDTQHKVVFKFTVIYSYMPRTHSFSDSLLSALMHAIQASNVRSQSSLLHTKLTAFRSSTNIDMYSGNCSGSVQNEWQDILYELRSGSMKMLMNHITFQKSCVRRYKTQEQLLMFRCDERCGWFGHCILWIEHILLLYLFISLGYYDHIRFLSLSIHLSFLCSFLSFTSLIYDSAIHGSVIATTATDSFKHFLITAKRRISQSN